MVREGEKGDSESEDARTSLSTSFDRVDDLNMAPTPVQTPL